MKSVSVQRVQQTASMMYRGNFEAGSFKNLQDLLDRAVSLVVDSSHRLDYLNRSREINIERAKMAEAAHIALERSVLYLKSFDINHPDNSSLNQDLYWINYLRYF